MPSDTVYGPSPFPPIDWEGVENPESSINVESSPVAVKFDQEKLRWDLLPFGAVREIVKVLTYGSQKYADRNWEKGFNYTRVFGSLMRHLDAWYQGEDVDPDTNLSHLSHAGCNILFLLHFVLTHTGTDDRPKY